MQKKKVRRKQKSSGGLFLSNVFARLRLAKEKPSERMAFLFFV
jgi:hypothetical protein